MCWPWLDPYRFLTCDLARFVILWKGFWVVSLVPFFMRMRLEVNIFKGKYVVIVISQVFFSRKDNNQKFCVRFAKNVYDRMISLVWLCMPKDIFKPTHRHIALWWSMVSHCHSVSGYSFFLWDFLVIRIARLGFSWPFFYMCTIFCLSKQKQIHIWFYCDEKSSWGSHFWLEMSLEDSKSVVEK